MPVIAPVVYPYLYGNLFDGWARMGELKAKEANEQWHKSLKSKFIERFNALGFNIIAMNSLSYGARCFVASRKYPNLYSSFEVSLDNVTNSVTWKCYLKERHWSTFDVSLTNLLSMLGMMPKVTKKVGLFGLFRKEVLPEPLMSLEQFYETAEMSFKGIGVTPTPYKFIYEDNNDDEIHEELDRNTNWFSDHNEMLHFTVGKGEIIPLNNKELDMKTLGEIVKYNTGRDLRYDECPCGIQMATMVKHYLKIDMMQYRLLQMFKNNTVGESIKLQAK